MEKKPLLQLVGGTDLSVSLGIDPRSVKINDLLSAKNLDLEALARELGQFGPELSDPKVTHERVSFMITHAQKVLLGVLGYSDAAIHQMTPTQAHSILRLK